MELYRGMPLGCNSESFCQNMTMATRTISWDRSNSGSRRPARVSPLCVVTVVRMPPRAVEGVWEELSPEIVKFVNGIAGTDDDIIEKSIGM